MYNQECKGPFQATTAIVLASASPRRRDLMNRLGLGFQVSVATSQELGPESGLTPAELVEENAWVKAEEIASKRRDALVIGADTCVSLGDRIFGKPEDLEDAINMLSYLSGRWHRVYTGFCILWPAKAKRVVRVVATKVSLAQVSPDVIRSYCATGEPLDKAGAYAVQGAGSFMVRKISGSWTNVVGLPITELVESLMDLGAIRPCVQD